MRTWLMASIIILGVMILGVFQPALAGEDMPPYGHGRSVEGKKWPFPGMDANNDGMVSKAEADTFHESHFKKMDANSDGSVTKEEAEIFHKAKREEFRKKMCEDMK